jgi:hypothetical protein
MTRRALFLVSACVCGALALAGPARAQLVLPGAAPPAASGASVAPLKPKRMQAPKAAPGAHASPATGKTAGLPAPGLEGVAGKPLMLDGHSGVLQVSGSSDALRIDTLKLAGEGVADSSQKCVVDIVGETPIAATKVQSQDGLAWYEAEVPACPFSFEVLTGAIRVPSQITACVFKAADCQTSPGGVWGPDGATLAPQADSIGKRRGAAEKAMSRALRAIEEKTATNADAAALVMEQKDFAGQRDESCHGYDKEAIHGFCASALTEARAALLEARLAGFAPAKAAKSEHGAPKKAPKKKKPAAPSAPPPAPQPEAPAAQ